MSVRLLAASAALLASVATAVAAQEAEQVYVEVDGAAVEVPVELAATACGMDSAAVTAAAADAMGATPSEDAAATDPAAEEVTTAQGTADPSTTEPGNADLLALAICAIDVETAAGLGIPTGNEVVTD